MDQNQNISESNELRIIESEVKKIFILIEKINIPQDIKESLLELFPSFSLENLDRLSKILEVKYLDQQTQDIDDNFKSTLSELIEDYRQQESEID